MSTAFLHKSIVQSHRQCPRRAWLEADGRVQPQFSAAAEAMLEQGKTVHAAARRALIGAVTIQQHLALQEAANQTAAAIAGGARTIVEAAFVAVDVGVRVDILECDADGVHLNEVKSGSGVKDKYLDDVAIQFACLERAGVTVKSASISHPSTARTLNATGEGASVLVREDVTDTVRWRSKRVAAWLMECAETLASAEPQTAPGPQCEDPQPCPFSGHCGKLAKQTETDRVAYLPSKAGAVAECIAAGISKISELPAEAFTNARNALVRDAILRGGPVVREAFSRKLASLGYPRSFLDFETAGAAIPLHVGMRPFQPVPFQWSCHREHIAGQAPEHAWFLDTSGKDPRRDFAESLLSFIGTTGPVLVYSGFEKGRLRELATLFPDLADPLRSVIARLVDLLPLARRGYYSPSMRGSWSIKSILPTLPGAMEAGLLYDELGGVSDGMAAQAAYLQLIDLSVIGMDKDAKRAELLDYCAMDTAGLHYLCRYVESHHAKELADVRSA